jgi:predicted dehydrogenase
MDFGCYGANLITWLMKGERPLTVTAITQHFKPQIYPKVEDEATIVLTYPSAQGIIQASWNWPYNRKDMEVYTTDAYYIADKTGLRSKGTSDDQETVKLVAVREKPYNDPFAYFGAVVRNEIQMTDDDLSSLPNNMVVMEILDAAKRSASEGKTVLLKH